MHMHTSCQKEFCQVPISQKDQWVHIPRIYKSKLHESKFLSQQIQCSQMSEVLAAKNKKD